MKIDEKEKYNLSDSEIAHFLLESFFLIIFQFVISVILIYYNEGLNDDYGSFSLQMAQLLANVVLHF